MGKRENLLESLKTSGLLTTHDEIIKGYANVRFVLVEKPSESLLATLEADFDLDQEIFQSFDSYLKIWRKDQLSPDISYICLLSNWAVFEWEIEEEGYIDEAPWGDVEYEALIALYYGLTEDGEWIQDCIYHPYNRLTPWIY